MCGAVNRKAGAIEIAEVINVADAGVVDIGTQLAGELSLLLQAYQPAIFTDIG